MGRLLIIAGALAASVISTQTVLAGSTITSVDASKYDLTMKGDVDAIHREIIAAATRVGREEYRGWEYTYSKPRALRKCVHGTTDDAVKYSGRDELVAYHTSLDENTRYDVARGTSPAEDEMASLAK